MTEVREMNESGLGQGADESLVYTLDVSPWGSGPTGVQVKIYDVTGGAYSDMSQTMLTGVASIAGDAITLPALSGLVPSHVYRLEVKFTIGSNTFEAWCTINGER
jgi:hypothetical protein